MLDGINSIVNGVHGILDKFFPDKMSDNDKAVISLEIQKLVVSETENLVNAQKEVMVAEIKSDVGYVRRARPTIAYTGLAIIVINFCIFPIIAWSFLKITGSTIELPTLNIPTDFWYVWGTVVGIYSFGRTTEKIKGVK